MKKITLRLLLACSVMLTAFQNTSNAQDYYLGEIRLVGFGFAPSGWAKCEGQLLSIAQNTALFALIGTTYGGNGQTTFALPDLRGRVPMGQGSGTGLTATTWGEQQGSENTTLLVANLPAHTHNLNVYNGSGTLDSLSGGTTYLSLIQNPDLSRSNAFGTIAPNATLSPLTVTSSGMSSTPFSNKQPSLTMYYIIATTGIFPTQ
jgi:microcystin-dependent protein